MNYRILKWIIQIILVLLFVLIDKFIYKKKSSINKKVLLFEFIFIALVYLCPFYVSFIKFNSLEDAFKFYKPNNDILQQYTVENYTYVIYKELYSIDVYCFKKENNKWNFYIWNTFYSLHDWSTKSYYDYELSIKNGPNKETKIIELEYEDNNRSHKVYDSLNSKIFTLKYNVLNDNYITHIIIADIKNEEKYRIYINDDIIKPFDFFNSKIETNN